MRQSVCNVKVLLLHRIQVSDHVLVDVTQVMPVVYGYDAVVHDDNISYVY